MVVLVDLDEEPLEDAACKPPHAGQPLEDLSYDHAQTWEYADSHEPERPNPNPNFHSGFSASLGCYPIVSALASHLDLNSLHDLSLTCRQFRANLLQFRTQLIKQTLHCVNEEQDFGPKLADRFRQSQHTWTGIGTNGRSYQGNNRDRLTSGRVGRCARDMVGDCRRCGVIVCRNCTIKAPSSKALEERHRRLCRTCLKAPLEYHLTQPLNHESETPASTPSLSAADIDPFTSMIRRTSTPSTPSTCNTPPPTSHAIDATSSSFTTPAFSRYPCTCPSVVYLCHSCGSAMRTADVTYSRGWAWRTRYSTYLGGLGTGIGEGNEGVACGKGASCLAAKCIEKEIDADADQLALMESEGSKVEEEGGGRKWGGTSFFTQEIEGIGGRVKRKVKRRIRVGAVVKEYEDERERGDFLRRERSKMNRGWCAWCERVVLGVKDLDGDVNREVGWKKEGKMGKEEADLGARVTLLG